MAKHEVKPGDCTLSLASRAGLFWKQVWSHAENAALAAHRKHPTILMPGDLIEVPEISLGELGGGTESRHKFIHKGTPARLRLRLRAAGEPLGSKEVSFVVDSGAPIKQTTDADGRVEIEISPAAAEVRLRVGEDQGEYLLKLGWLDPIDETSGLQARLFNLGYDPQGIDNDYGKNTRKAMQAFQKAAGVGKSRTPNDETRAALEAEYGC